MPIKQFIKADELPPEPFEKPYFVAPEDDVQAKAIRIMIMRKALAQTNTLGEIAFSGREHLVAIGALRNSLEGEKKSGRPAVRKASRRRQAA